MGLLWPSGWTRWRRGALLLVNGVSLWLTALLVHVYQNPLVWNISRSTPSQITETAVTTTRQWVMNPVWTPSEGIAYLGGVLLCIGIGWYWLLRPVVVRYTGVLSPISDSEAEQNELAES